MLKQPVPKFRSNLYARLKDITEKQAPAKLKLIGGIPWKAKPLINILDLPRRWGMATHRARTQEEVTGGWCVGWWGEGGRPSLRQRI